MTKYIQRTDGEGFVVPLEEKYRLACCDCGLVHDIVWVYDEETKELGMAVQRNNRATAQRRKRHQTKPLSDEEETLLMLWNEYGLSDEPMTGDALKVKQVLLSLIEEAHGIK